MRYKTKMMLIYACFIAILALGIGLAYYNYNIDRHMEREQQSLTFYAKELAQQFDGSIQMMEFAINSLVYDIEVVNSLLQWSNDGQNPSYPIHYTDEASATLHSRLYRDTLDAFHRVIIFNRYGRAVANRTNAKRAIDPSVTWQDLPWLSQVTGTGGRNVLIPPHADDWSADKTPLVYSYVKEVQGSNMGYIEVQYEASHLDEIMQVADANVQVALLYPDDQVMYASDGMDRAECLRIAAEAEAGTYHSRDRQIVAVQRSEITGAMVLLLMSGQQIADATGYIFTATLAVCVVFALCSLLFVYLISSYLTKPIEEVHRMIRHTQIETLQRPVRRMKSINEIETLVDAYQDLMGRLSSAIETERQVTRLHMKTQFDALQAQVNPHFLFNVLNVISQRGMNDGDLMICELCASLAAILRYSTNTRQRLATVEEELAYLSQYAFLLKSRYQHMFECDTEADAIVGVLEIPRLTIQQLVENSISHGYANSAVPMRIRVRAYHEGNASYICVQDNGQGFPPGKVEALQAGFREIRQGLSQEKTTPEMEIGGMGLRNIYARLYLVFEDRMEIQIVEDGETTVIIRIRDAKEG